MYKLNYSRFKNQKSTVVLLFALGLYIAVASIFCHYEINNEVTKMVFFYFSLFSSLLFLVLIMFFAISKYKKNNHIIISHYSLISILLVVVALFLFLECVFLGLYMEKSILNYFSRLISKTESFFAYISDSLSQISFITLEYLLTVFPRLNLINASNIYNLLLIIAASSGLIVITHSLVCLKINIRSKAQDDSSNNEENEDNSSKTYLPVLEERNSSQKKHISIGILYKPIP